MLTEINRASIVKAARLSASFPPIIEWLNYSGMTLVLLFGAWQARRAELPFRSTRLFYLREQVSALLSLSV